MALVDRLQRVLTMTDMTPYDLSKRAGLSTSQVRQWIDRRSERVAAEQLRKARRLLDRLPAGRQPTAASLAQLVPYRAAPWCAQIRARQLQRVWFAASF